ncbi:globin family protein [Thioclava nitratireducens]|uniref:Globin family protein n=1 Tax=Thioclava nitratireducens TaxID=1915078 RepID=A0ABM6IDP1_9RHOB|nr:MULTISPECIES: group III truncated hemoglobin [Thioclava]AQS46863.1 globin family protein [Thioclava nitratireducens]OWY08500.1 globin family protein [Thioclava sp. F42-5]
MANPLARFEITEAEIDRVVARFYERVREHAMLGPVFAVHVTDWPTHEDKVARFWKNAILRKPVYDGSPMQVHRAAGNVRPGMFSTWLAEFDKVLREELSPEQAEGWSALAHRIGMSLRQGVVERETLPGGIPKLK